MTKKRTLSQRKITSAILVLLVLVIGSFALAVSYLTSPANSSDTSNSRFTIAKGESISSIANNLQTNNFIRSATAFKVYIRVYDLTSSIQAGEHIVSPSLSLPEIVEALSSGHSDIWVTIPEGLRNEEIVEILSSSLDIDEALLTPAVKGKQGFLYPDTYLIPLGLSPEEIIAILESNYESKLSSLRPLINSTGYSENEIVTLASIIERETLTDDEKPIVAGILLKRMANGWALETDATIQYIIGSPGEWWPVPTIPDRQISSPYNTYENTGLPPTPISNPGLESIRSVLYPIDTDYWFYLHDRSGIIHYGSTLEDHNQNIENYIR